MTSYILQRQSIDGAWYDLSYYAVLDNAAQSYNDLVAHRPTNKYRVVERIDKVVFLSVLMTLRPWEARDMMTDVKRWHGPVPQNDAFGDHIPGEFIDGKTRQGPWAIMTPTSHKRYGVGLGTGKGQRYEKRGDYWIKVEG